MRVPFSGYKVVKSLYSGKIEEKYFFVYGVYANLFLYGIWGTPHPLQGPKESNQMSQGTAKPTKTTCVLNKTSDQHVHPFSLFHFHWAAGYSLWVAKDPTLRHGNSED